MKRLVYCIATFLLKTRLVSECSSPLNEILLKGKWGGGVHGVLLLVVAAAAMVVVVSVVSDG